MQVTSPIRPALIDGRKSWSDITNDVCRQVEAPPTKLWFVAFAISLALFGYGAYCLITTWVVGIGVWGLNKTVGWAWDITNFVWWVGIGHAGTLISAVLLLFRQKWRTSINRAAEAMTIFAVLCAATFDIPITDVKKETPFKAGVTYRDVQKTINFGLAYGMSKFKLADTMQIPVDEADRIIKKFFKIVPKVEQFLNGCGELGKQRGYIRTPKPFRRVRWFEGWQDKGDFKKQGEIERAAKNTPIQGCNADVVKLALIKVQNYIDLHNYPAYIILSVYDEIQTECLEEKAEEWKEILNQLMLEAAETVIKSVPFVVDCKISDYWEK
jgi:hypothetical protein